MSEVLSGGCACGAVRYTSRGPALFALNCHCRDCQRESGGAFVPVLAVERAGFEFDGTPRRYTRTAASGYATTRLFCGDCGSPVFGFPGSAPELVTIRAGSLDDPSVFEPAIDVFTDSAQPWDCMDPDLPKATHLPEPT